MLSKVKKIVMSMYAECKTRGFYHFFMMYFSNSISVFRGIIYKLFYFSNIKSSIYFIQARTKLDIFSKDCKVTIRPFVFIRRNGTIRVDHKGELYIGDKVFINDNCSINCINKISIGEHTKIGPNVSINDNDHNFRGIGEERMVTGEVNIGSHVWIGANTVILRNTSIGDHAVIAAGSIVKGDIPAHTVYRSTRENKVVGY